MKWLRFFDLMDDEKDRLSWTKIGVAMTTILTAVTGTATAIQAATTSIAATDFYAFAAAIGLHGISTAGRSAKRWTEKR